MSQPGLHCTGGEFEVIFPRLSAKGQKISTGNPYSLDASISWKTVERSMLWFHFWRTHSHLQGFWLRFVEPDLGRYCWQPQIFPGTCRVLQGESKSLVGCFMTEFDSEERLPGPVAEKCHEYQCICWFGGYGGECGPGWGGWV
jgi:hypothetical protein